MAYLDRARRLGLLDRGRVARDERGDGQRAVAPQLGRLVRVRVRARVRVGARARVRVRARARARV